MIELFQTALRRLHLKALPGRTLQTLTKLSCKLGELLARKPYNHIGHHGRITSNGTAGAMGAQLQEVVAQFPSQTSNDAAAGTISTSSRSVP